MALQLVDYLGRRGSYEAFDIYGDGVAWCRHEITTRHPNFRFHHADLFSSRYNQHAAEPADRYRFPWDDASFDFGFLTSVFTHLLPADLEHYMAELGRVIRPGGRSFITWFLLNEESRRLLAAGKGDLSVTAVDEVHAVHSTDVPEWAVAYDEDYVVELYRRNGFVPRRPLHAGGWAGRGQFMTAHDVVIADRQP
jgi:SAM-dependent methyltransferase